MAKYVLLYSGGGMPETEEETAKVLQAWGTWYDALGDKVVDPGYPFTPVAKTVASDGSVSDGAALNSSGYTILEAGSIDEAVRGAKGCPILAAGGNITVLETLEMG